MDEYYLVCPYLLGFKADISGGEAKKQRMKIWLQLLKLRSWNLA